MTCGIYKVTSPSGQIYIGQSRRIEKRWSVLKARKRDWEPLYQSFMEYGKENHSFEIIHSLPIDIGQSILDDYERIYIDQYINCGFRLFNKQKGGKWGGGNVVTEETRNKIRNTLRGQKHTPERIKNIKAARKMTPEVRKRISESLKKYYNK